MEKKSDQGRGWRKRFCCTGRQRSTRRAEGRGGLELGRVVSCRSGDRRGRTELDFGSGEPLDNLHRSTALGAAIQGRGVFSGRSELFVGWVLCHAEQVEAEGQSGSPAAVGKEAEMPDAHEALRKDVQ